MGWKRQSFHINRIQEESGKHLHSILYILYILSLGISISWQVYGELQTRLGDVMVHAPLLACRKPVRGSIPRPFSWLAFIQGDDGCVRSLFIKLIDAFDRHICISWQSRVELYNILEVESLCNILLGNNPSTTTGD